MKDSLVWESVWISNLYTTFRKILIFSFFLFFFLLVAVNLEYTTLAHSSVHWKDLKHLFLISPVYVSNTLLHNWRVSFAHHNAITWRISRFPLFLWRNCPRAASSTKREGIFVCGKQGETVFSGPTAWQHLKATGAPESDDASRHIAE